MLLDISKDVMYHVRNKILPRLNKIVLKLSLNVYMGIDPAFSQEQ